MRSQDKETATLNIPLRDTLRRVDARCNVTLPLTVETSPSTMHDLYLALLFSSALLVLIVAHRPTLLSVLLPFECLLGLIASPCVSKVVLGSLAGTGRIVLSAESIDDSSLETGAIPWKDIKAATYFVSERTSSLWAELRLVDGRTNPHPFRNSLRVRGFAGWKRDRAYVDLQNADQSDVVLGAILELARIYGAADAKPSASIRKQA